MATALGDYLETWAAGEPERSAVAAVVSCLAGAAAELSRMIALGPLLGETGAVVGDNADGDKQKALDVQAHDLFIDALRAAPVAAVASEESEAPVLLRPGEPLAVAIDPLDGSSNIETNVSVGTIFSVLSMPGEGGDPASAFRRPGAAQLAAGLVVYGPQTVLVLTMRDGVHVFTLDREAGAFLLTRGHARLPEDGAEYAINASNYRHWDGYLRAYVDDCVAGADGPHAAEFNMRWIASLVAEAFRILARGGIFLYPRDGRPGYGEGRLRLVYEAHPLALIVEEAGGAAVAGDRRILDLVPQTLHQRTPLVFGSRKQVERLALYRTGPPPVGERSPLFGRRGLFRT